MATRISNIKKVGSGHWSITVEKENYCRKYPHFISSLTIWSYTTTDSMSIDAYYSDDSRRSKNGEKRLIFQAKNWGVKEIVKNY